MKTPLAQRFGIDLVFPGIHGEETAPQEYLKEIPPSHLSFVKKLLDDAGIEDFSPADRDEFMAENADKMAMPRQRSRRQLEISLDMAVNLIVGALGIIGDGSNASCRRATA
jgi:hypothetical protein